MGEGVPRQPVTLAGALVDSDDAYLPGAGAGPDGESGDGAVMLGLVDILRHSREAFPCPE